MNTKGSSGDGDFELNNRVGKKNIYTYDWVYVNGSDFCQKVKF